MRCERLAPNTAVPQRAITASTVPSSALATGTLAPTVLRSSALRTPITRLMGAPIDQRLVASGEGVSLPTRSLSRALRAARKAGHRPSAMTTSTTARLPSHSTTTSKVIPVELSATRASPRGAIGDRRAAIATAPMAPVSPTTRLRTVPSTTSCRRFIPSAIIVGNSSLSARLCRPMAWPTTVRPTSAASAASSHHPMAWGRIEASTDATWESTFWTKTVGPRALTAAWNRGTSAKPWWSRTK